jgi:hypothetical protein
LPELYWADCFPVFSEKIQTMLNMPQYRLGIHGCRLIMYLDCKFDETCTPGTRPMMNEEWAEWWPKADLIQASVYLGYGS